MPVHAESQTRLEPEERKQQLLLFGREYFAESPRDGASMSEIARLAGVSKGLLYHYFGDRHGFYLATVRDAVDGLIETIDDALAAQPTDELRAIISAFAAYCRNNAGIYRAVIRGGHGADTEVMAETQRARDFILDRVLQLIGIRRPTAVQKLRLVGWIAFAEAATDEWVQMSRVSRTEFVDLLIDTLNHQAAQFRARGTA